MQFNEWILNSYKHNLNIFSSVNLPRSIKMFSGKFFDLWKAKGTAQDIYGSSFTLGGPLSFVYIDGDHFYAGAKQDFENTDAVLETGGFILFDDSADDTDWEVKRVVKEMLATGRYELVMKNPNYLFRKIR